MVDNPVLEAGAVRRESSSLSRRTWPLSVSELTVRLLLCEIIAACRNYDMQFSQSSWVKERGRSVFFIGIFNNLRRKNQREIIVKGQLRRISRLYPDGGMVDVVDSKPTLRVRVRVPLWVLGWFIVFLKLSLTYWVECGLYHLEVIKWRRTLRLHTIGNLFLIII